MFLPYKNHTFPLFFSHTDMVRQIPSRKLITYPSSLPFSLPDAYWRTGSYSKRIHRLPAIITKSSLQVHLSSGAFLLFLWNTSQLICWRTIPTLIVILPLYFFFTLIEFSIPPHPSRLFPLFTKMPSSLQLWCPTANPRSSHLNSLST